MTITKDTTVEQLRMELAKFGVSICQLSMMPDGSRRCDVADSGFHRGYGEGPDEWTAINSALEALARALLDVPALERLRDSVDSPRLRGAWLPQLGPVSPKR